MIIIIINDIGITVYKLEKHAPIAGYFNCIKSLFVATQLMEKGTRTIHVLYLAGGIKAIKNAFKPTRMFRLYSFLAPRVKKVLQAFMFKRLYHASFNVT